MIHELKPRRNRSSVDVEFKIARSRDELYRAFRLVYRSYIRAGLFNENPSHLRLTPYHLLDSSEVLIAQLRGEVISTLSLFGDAELGLPMETMYPHEIAQLRAEGRRIAEVGSFADRREKQVRFINLLQEMGRLLGQTAKANGYDTLVAVVHPKHARLYKRILGFEQIGDHSSCPYANDNPAEALCLKFETYLGTEYQTKYFENRFDPAELVGYQWEPETKRFFQRILDADGKIAKLTGMEDSYPWGSELPNLTPTTRLANHCNTQS